MILHFIGVAKLLLSFTQHLKSHVCLLILSHADYDEHSKIYIDIRLHQIKKMRVLSDTNPLPLVTFDTHLFAI